MRKHKINLSEAFGIPSQRFLSPEEYKDFLKRWQEEVVPRLKENERKLALSWKNSAWKILN